MGSRWSLRYTVAHLAGLTNISLQVEVGAWWFASVVVLSDQEAQDLGEGHLGADDQEQTQEHIKDDHKHDGVVVPTLAPCSDPLIGPTRSCQHP